jgi:malate dehydrogenase
MNFMISDTGWHQRARGVVDALRQQKTPRADDLAEDITVQLSRAHRVETFRELHERILVRLDRLCDEAQTLLLSKIVVGVTGASGGIGKETMLQAARSGLAKKVIGLVRISGRGPATGNVMDLTDRLHLERLDSRRAAIEVRTYEDLADEPAGAEPVDVFIHTIGLGRKPAPMNPDTWEPVGKTPTREELLARNQWVLKSVVQHTYRASPDALNIFVTNPIGHRLMQVVLEAGVPADKILGFGGELDSARFRQFIWQAMEEAGHGVVDVRAQVIGEHTNNMIPLLGSEVTFASGVTLSLERCLAEGLVSAEKVQQIMDRTIQRGLEIVESQGTSAVRSPARGLVVMLERLLRGNVVNGLSYRPYRNGSASFVGGPVRLQNGLAVMPEPMEHDLGLTRSEKERWLKAMQANCMSSD